MRAFDAMMRRPSTSVERFGKILSEQSAIAFWLSLPFAAHATPSCFSNLAARSARHGETAPQRITTMELPLDSFNSFRQGLLDPGPDTHHFSFLHNKSYSGLF